MAPTNLLAWKSRGRPNDQKDGNGRVARRTIGVPGRQLFQDGQSVEREPLEAPNDSRWTITHD
jgi:hypothetical protein